MEKAFCNLKVVKLFGAQILGLGLVMSRTNKKSEDIFYMDSISELISFLDCILLLKC